MGGIQSQERVEEFGQIRGHTGKVGFESLGGQGCLK